MDMRSHYVVKGLQWLFSGDFGFVLSIDCMFDMFARWNSSAIDEQSMGN